MNHRLSHVFYDRWSFYGMPFNYVSVNRATSRYSCNVCLRAPGSYEITSGNPPTDKYSRKSCCNISSVFLSYKLKSICLCFSLVETQEKLYGHISVARDLPRKLVAISLLNNLADDPVKKISAFLVLCKRRTTNCQSSIT